MNKDPWQPLEFLGSFQNGYKFWSEDPRTEAWHQLMRLSTPEYSSSLLLQINKSSKQLELYIQARIQQAFELRQAAQGQTSLTSPLTLYYSFLNLVRALIALKTGQKAPPTHGLKIQYTSDDVLESTALLRRGTFHEFLSVMKCLPLLQDKEVEVSLKQAFACIPELDTDLGASQVAKVRVSALMEEPGGINLHFYVPGISSETFRAKWHDLFPSLVEAVKLADSGSSLVVTQQIDRDYQAVSKFCHEYLLNDLVMKDQPIWHLIYQQGETPILNRSAYYFIGMFILSSIVRYEPEKLLGLVRIGSNSSWLINRFINKADRFFPQLIYSLILEKAVYF